MLAKVWNLILLIAVTYYGLTCADFFEQCEGKDQTYVKVNEDCTSYIFCHGEDSFTDTCPDDSPYFSIEEQTCDVNKDVCQDRAIIGETTTIREAEDASNLTSSSAMPSSSSSLTITIPTATTSSSTDFPTTSSSKNSTANQITTTVMPSPSVPTFCPPVDNPYKAVFLPHKKSCSEYFLCYQGERLPMRCSKMLHFDVRQQKCDYPENVKCQMMDFVSPREQCLPHTFDFYPHARNCNYYYQCTLGYLRVMQCPLNMGWHYEKRTCVRRSQAKCYSSIVRAISK